MSGPDSSASPEVRHDFLSRLNHDLRTPLTTILGFSELLERQALGDLNAKQLQSVVKIRACGLQLQGLIQDVLELSELESGGVTMTAFPVQQMIWAAVKQYAPVAKGRDISFSLQIGDGLQAYGHMSSLKSALGRLLDNAIKFSQAGGKIEVYARGCPDPTPGGDCAASGVVVEVKDEGAGISLDKQADLFVTATARPQGPGLGLSLVRRTVAAHAGKVWLESEGVPGKGSRFFVWLPSEPPPRLANPAPTSA